MKPLAEEDKNFAGFIARRLLERSMLETTNISQGTPDNGKAILTSGYLRLTIQRINILDAVVCGFLLSGAVSQIGSLGDF